MPFEPFAGSRGLPLVAILTLTLGISANTAIFSVVNAVVLRPLKAPDAASLVRFITTTGASTSIAGAQSFDVWRQQTRRVRGRVGAPSRICQPDRGKRAGTDSGCARHRRILSALSCAGPERSYVYGVRRPGGRPSVAVLSHALWTRRFQNDPAVLGRRVSLGNVPYVVVGILASEFDTEQFDPQPDVWVPFQLDARRVDAGNLFTVTGRLTAGTTRAAANAQLAVALPLPVVTRREASAPGPCGAWNRSTTPWSAACAHR